MPRALSSLLSKRRRSHREKDLGLLATHERGGDSLADGGFWVTRRSNKRSPICLSYQPNMNFERISESIREGVEERSGYANVMFKRLLEEIQEFESGLKHDEEIGAYLASFAGGIRIHIESIKYQDPYYIVLSGTTEQNQKVRLVQHVTQTSILFVPVKVTSEENREPRRFGFNVSGSND